MSNAEVFEKMDLSTPDLVNENAQKIAQLFPNCVVESRGSDGAVKHSIDFDTLKQELSHDVASDDAQRYQMTWPGKAESVIEGNAPIDKTLRPSRDESVDFDTTKNLFIEGDNLDALKLLQETYLGKVKMIYIDPPYNTGNDFVYKDNFKAKKEDFDEDSDYTDEDGGRLVSNPESNGRYHSDWLSMIYPRLRLARNLLKDEGVIFISIDDNEQANLKKLCDEVFGEDNFVGNVIWEKRYGRSNNAKLMTTSTEHVILYRKSSALNVLREVRTGDHQDGYSNPDNDSRGIWTSVSFVNQVTREARPNLSYTIKNPNTGEKIDHPTSAWKVSKEKYETFSKENRLHWGANGDAKYPRIKRFFSELDEGMVPVNFWKYKDAGTVDLGTKEVKELMGVDAFTFPKPTKLIKKMLSLFNPEELSQNKNDIILDFFAGSGTTAHAVMALNAEDGGNRKCISVQLPEVTDSKSEAYKAGYKTIAEISKERIRRAGKKILADNAESKEPKDLSNLDTGFRVLKVATGNRLNIKDVPSAERQEGLFDKIGNIKSDRSGEDLLFGVMLDWGIDLSLPIETLSIGGKTVYAVYDRTDVENTYPLLMACFSDDITDAFTQEIATHHKPLRMVFKDESFRGNDSAKINTAEIFKTISPATQVKVI